MYCVRKVTDDLLWIGGNDRQHPLFESAHPVPRGMSFNSYLLLDEKTVLFDTVDRAVQTQFFENLEYALNGRKLDYVFVHHMEPDHAATLGDLMIRHPEATIVCNGKSLNMIRQFHATDPKGAKLVNEGDTITTGRHTFTFVNAPMVHWPEVMVSYDSTDKILFSADAGRGPPVLHQHRGQVRPPGPGPAEEGRRPGHPDDLPPPRPRVAQGSGLYSGQVCQVGRL